MAREPCRTCSLAAQDPRVQAREPWLARAPRPTRTERTGRRFEGRDVTGPSPRWESLTSSTMTCRARHGPPSSNETRPRGAWARSGWGGAAGGDYGVVRGQHRSGAGERRGTQACGGRARGIARCAARRARRPAGGRRVAGGQRGTVPWRVEGHSRAPGKLPDTCRDGSCGQHRAIRMDGMHLGASGVQGVRAKMDGTEQLRFRSKPPRRGLRGLGGGGCSRM